MFKDEKKKKLKTPWQKIWYFIWEDDSVLSWIVNIVIAFVLIKFLIYPGLGLVFGTTHPVVAVVSGSMEHKIVYETAANGDMTLRMCGNTYEEKTKVNFDYFWTECGMFYLQKNITKEDFGKFPFKNGFNTGDIIVLFGTRPEKINVGDVIVFISSKSNPKPDPIIHRVIASENLLGEYSFQTKGDHNPYSINGCDNTGKCVFESDISKEQIIGKAVFRIPWLGYIKIWFVDFLNLVGLNKTVGTLF